VPIAGPDSPIPALRRALEAVPIEEGERRLLLLRDLEDITTQAIALSPASLALAVCFDSKRTASDVAALFAKHTGQPIDADEILGLARDLEKNLLLETPETDARRRTVEKDFRDNPVRQPSSAGRAYPAARVELTKLLDGFFAGPDGPGQGFAAPTVEPPIGLMAPHIDFPRGGHAYAWSYQALSQSRPPDAIVALGVAHMSPNSPWVMTPKAYGTPLGPMGLNRELYDELRATLWYDPQFEEMAHRTEHSLELQAVWLRHLWGDKTPPWVPILCSSFERFCPEGAPSKIETIETALKKMGEVLARRRQAGQRILVLAAVDLAHVGPRFGDERPVSPERAKIVDAEDRGALASALDLKADEFYLSVMRDGNKRKVCGLSALYTALRLMSSLAEGTSRPGTLLAYRQAPDPEGGLVSFASAIWR
jgi:AmmeMemoRadiSam system protein B